MSDVHGCYDEIIKMLEKINFSQDDTLIMAGDYVDRGPKNYEVLEWIRSAPDNVVFLRGNHDVEFIYHVNLLSQYMESGGFQKDDPRQTAVAYTLLCRAASAKQGGVCYFDYYGTIAEMIRLHRITASQLEEWALNILGMEFVWKKSIEGREFIVVHAGYTERRDFERMEGSYYSVEEFYTQARNDAYLYGGAPNSTIIAGHTPTLIEGELPYNAGDVYRFYDSEQDCIFYDIDCGCVFGIRYPEAKLACIRLEDEEIFYVRREK